MLFEKGNALNKGEYFWKRGMSLEKKKKEDSIKKISNNET